MARVEIRPPSRPVITHYSSPNGRGGVVGRHFADQSHLCPLCDVTASEAALTETKKVEPACDEQSSADVAPARAPRVNKRNSARTGDGESQSGSDKEPETGN